MVDEHLQALGVDAENLPPHLVFPRLRTAAARRADEGHEAVGIAPVLIFFEEAFEAGDPGFVTALDSEGVTQLTIPVTQMVTILGLAGVLDPRQTLSTLSGAQYVFDIEGAGTYVESDAPEEFTTAIRDWMIWKPSPRGSCHGSRKANSRRSR